MGWAAFDIQTPNDQSINAQRDLTIAIIFYLLYLIQLFFKFELLIFKPKNMKKSTLLKNRVVLTMAITLTIGFNAKAQAPTTAAPNPTAAADVISMYSDVYTNVGVDTWLTSWSAGNTSTLQIAGNNTRVYTNLDFVGVETTSANLINATSMTKFNINVYTPNMTQFRVKLVDFGANGIYQGSPNDDKEHEITYTPVQNAWISYSISLSDFTNLTTRAHIAQLILSGFPTASGTLYIDNVYFSKNSTATGINELRTENALNVYPNPNTGHVTIKIDHPTSQAIQIFVYNLMGELVKTIDTISSDYTTIDLSDLSNGFYQVQLNSDNNVQSKKIVLQR